MPKFPTELKEWKYIIERKAKRAGLDFFTTIFEIVDYDQMNELAAYGGFPTRWSHWQFGQEYEQLKTFYTYGLQKIYEMVINNDPCYAYLLEPNSLTDHKTVIAHVYGHNDFFKNNIWFAPVPRNKIDELGNHRYRIEELKEEAGIEAVEDFLDKVLSIEWLIDDHSLMIRREPKKPEDDNEEEDGPRRLGSKDTRDYMDGWLNPFENIKKEQGKAKEEKEKRKLIERGLKIPLKPTRDILLFLIQHAPLEQWQKEIIAIIREENYYFVPQAQTKIMNEGWAVYWHAKLMTEMGICEEKETFEYADHTSGTLTGFPYKMGYELFLDIEYRYDTGRHGKIWEECDIREIKENWDEFVIFKTFFDTTKGDKYMMMSKWQEFCTFCEALKEGKCDFPKELWSRKTMAKNWLSYLNTKDLAKEQAVFLEDAKNTWKQAIAYLEKTKSDSLTPEKKLAFEKQYQTRLLLAKQDIKEIKGNQNFLKMLSAVKKAIDKGALPLIEKPIPQSFFDFANKYPDPIELGQGREKIFEVRKFYNDLTFIDEFLTEEICLKMKMFTYEPGGGGVPPDHWGIVSRACKMVKQKLLFQLTHRSQPVTELVDANYENRGEFYMKHIHIGMDLHLSYMKEVLKIIYECWQKPVHIETIVTEEKGNDFLSYMRQQMRRGGRNAEEDDEEGKIKGKKVVFTYNGENLTRNEKESVLIPEPF